MYSIQSAVEGIVLNDYASIAIVTAIGYDYILTFPNEVEYIWNQPWTSVSTLFVFVRYLSLCAYIGKFLYTWTCEGADLSIIAIWAVLGFICAADFIMILRAWAMWSRSRLILGILLTTYVGEVIPSTISCVFYSNPQTFTVTVFQILDFSFCSLQANSATWNKIADTTQLIHAAMMCTVVIIQFMRQSFRMYQGTKQWQLNRFINLLFMQGVLYFLCFLVWNLVNTLIQWNKISVGGWQVIPLGLAEALPMATLPCRFILSVRALYAHNARGGPSGGIDSGFGLSTLSTRSEATMVFAEDGEWNGVLSNGEEIPMEATRA